jgi:predicted metal-dependent HD superfamily phosphohydrolase
MWMRIITFTIAQAAPNKDKTESLIYLACGRIMDMSNKSYEHIIKLLLEKYGWVRVPLFIGGQYENRKN